MPAASLKPRSPSLGNGTLSPPLVDAHDRPRAAVGVQMEIGWAARRQRRRVPSPGSAWLFQDLRFLGMAWAGWFVPTAQGSGSWSVGRSPNGVRLLGLVTTIARAASVS